MRRIVKFDVEIQVEDGENYKAATVLPFGITAYADSIPAVLRRAEQGVYHLLDEYDERGGVWDFLNEHGVEYAVIVQEERVASSKEYTLTIHESESLSSPVLITREISGPKELEYAGMVE